MSLDDLERQLYSRSFDETKRAREGLKKRVAEGEPARDREDESSHANPPAPHSSVRGRWDETVPGDDEPHPLSLGKKLLFVGIGLAIVGLIGGGIIYFALSNRTGGDVVVSIDSPDRLYRGVPFDVTVSISNQRESVLRSATLSLSLPPGLISVGGIGSTGALVSEPVGDIGTGILTQKTFKLLPVGEIRSVQKIAVTLSYGAGGTSRFEVSQSREVFIEQSAISVEVKQLDKILSGSTFTVDVEYSNDSGFDFPDVAVEARYPPTFRFKSANITPDSLSSVWRLGALKAGSKGTLSVTGSIEGPEDARYGIPFTLSANFLGQSFPLVEKTADIVLAPSPITIDVSVNGVGEYVARIGDQLIYSVRYKNTSGIALADVVIRASVAGDVVNPTTVATDGQFDAVSNTILWNASNAPSLRLLDPGAGGSVSVAVGLKPTFPISRLSDKNFIVKFTATIDSPSVPFYLSASKTSATKIVETKVGGYATIDAQALYRDLRSGIVNGGSLPPKVGVPTEYTIHWVIRNAATDVSDVRISAFLRNGVTWTGKVLSSIASTPSWNERTQEVTWNIDQIPATKGILGDPIEAIFQVRAVPGFSDVGKFQSLMGPTKFVGIDGFTSLSIEASDGELTTALPDDPTVGQSAGTVIQ